LVFCSGLAHPVIIKAAKHTHSMLRKFKTCKRMILSVIFMGYPDSFIMLMITVEQMPASNPLYQTPMFACAGQLQHLAPKTTAVLLSHVHCGTCC